MKIIIISLFILSLFLIGCAKPIIPECEECPKEKAMITIVLDNYYLNEDNINEIFFSYNIINYGSKEAKNIKVQCIVADGNDNIVLRKTDNIGNIASTSSVYKELYVKHQLEDDVLYSPACFPISCDDCDILQKRIPEFKILIEKYFTNETG